VQEIAVHYAEKVAYAAAIGTAKIGYCCAIFRDSLRNCAFLSFPSSFREDFHDFCCGILQEVIDVPEHAFLVSEVA
jgi:hypothetical protein